MGLDRTLDSGMDTEFGCDSEIKRISKVQGYQYTRATGVLVAFSHREETYVGIVALIKTFELLY